MEEPEKMKCYKRLIYKTFFPSLRSGLFGPQFLSYLPKLFTHLCKVYGDAIFAPFWCTNIGDGNQQKHLELTFSIKALSFHWSSSIRAHKRIL